MGMRRGECGVWSAFVGKDGGGSAFIAHIAKAVYVVGSSVLFANEKVKRSIGSHHGFFESLTYEPALGIPALYSLS